MSSQHFENKKDELKDQFESLRRKLVQSLPSASGELRKQVIRDLERGSEDATILLHEMEDDARKAPPPYRMQMNNEIRAYQKDLQGISTDINRAVTSSESGRIRAFDPEDDFERMESSQRARMLEGTQAMNRASESVMRSQQIAAETDEIGYGIIDDLGEQRESLVRTRDRLVETQQNLSKSRKILQSMGRRLITNKLLLVIIIFLELCILGVVVYLRFFK